MSDSYWESCYRRGHVVWDPGPYDGNLPFVLKEFGIQTCRILDVGCGTGNSLVWLASKGFQCTGIDLAPTAIRTAEKSARREAQLCEWICGSFPDDMVRTKEYIDSFEVVLDRGCLQHLIYSDRQRMRFVEGITRVLEPGGLWYSLTPSSRGERNYGGIPKWSDTDLIETLEPYFDIMLLRESVFTPGESGSIPAWICVAREKDKR